MSVHHSLWLPLSCRQGGFQSLLPIGLAPTSTRSKSSTSFCRTGFFSIIRWRILSASTKWLAVHMSLQFGSAEVGVYPLFVIGGKFGNDIDSGLPDITHILGSPSVVRLARCDSARLDMYA